MNVLEMLRAARRHPIVLAICLVFTAVAAAGVYLTLPTNYEADASLQLLPPNTVIDANGKTQLVNPIGVAGGQSAQIEASVLAQVASSQPFVKALADKGVTSTTVVAVSTYGGGTILAVSATNADGPAAVRDLKVLVDGVTKELRTSQEELGAPKGSFLKLINQTGTGTPTPMTGSKVKLAAVTGVLGLIVTLLVVLLVDARARRRVERAEAESADKTELTPVIGDPARRGERRGARVARPGMPRRRQDTGGEEDLPRAQSR